MQNQNLCYHNNGHVGKKKGKQKIRNFNWTITLKDPCMNQSHKEVVAYVQFEGVSQELKNCTKELIAYTFL